MHVFVSLVFICNFNECFINHSNMSVRCEDSQLASCNLLNSLTNLAGQAISIFLLALQVCFYEAVHSVKEGESRP